MIRIGLVSSMPPFLHTLDPFFRSWTWKMAWRDSRRSRRRLLLYSTSIVLGVAALVAVGSFGQNLSDSIENQAKTLLGADLVLVSREELSEAGQAFIHSLGGEQAKEISFSSMISFQKTGRSRLVQVRALEGPFPFYGTFETEPHAAVENYRSGSGTLVEESLLRAFGAAPGDSIKIGATVFRIDGSLKKVPGETVAFGTIAPRVYIPMSNLSGTGLLKKGSLVRYKAYFRFAPDVVVQDLLNRIRPELEQYHLDADTVEHRKRDLGRAMTNLDHFLNLVGFIALLLGAIGIASAIHVHIKQKIPTVAMLRFIGCSSNQAFSIYLGQVIGLASAGVAAGVALGVAVQMGLTAVLGDFVPIRFSTVPSFRAMARGAGIGFAACLLFALLPLLRVRRVTPLGVLRALVNTLETKRHDPLLWVCYTLIGIGLIAFSISQSRHWQFGIWFAAGLAGAFGALTALAAALSALVRRNIGRVDSFTCRQGLANLYRPQNRTVLLTVCLGLGTFLILTLYLLQTNLVRNVLVADQANRADAVLFDIQSDQKEGVAQALESSGFPVLQDAPVVTMRIASINGRTAAEIRKEPGRKIPSWALRREYRSTYRGELADSEKLIAGNWQDTVAPGTVPVPVSFEEGIAKTLGVRIGDKVVFDIQGVELETKVASLREVDWRRLQPNFFVVFPIGVLEDAPRFHILVTKVGSSERSARMQSEITSRFPNVSIIDLTLVLQTIDGILGKVSFVVRFMALFTVGTGLLVLVSSVLTGRYQRLQESVLLRTLGASRGQIRTILIVEYLALGTLAAFTGILLSVAGSWALAHFVFRIPFNVSILPLLTTGGAVTLLTVVTGLATSRGACSQPPLEVLRTEA